MDDIQGGEPFVYQGHYISCMKINGVPLLPPLMTQEYRQEMQYYKQLAVAVERRISELKVCLDDTTVYSTNHPSDTEECFDAVNMSYDNIPVKSSLIDRRDGERFHGVSDNNYFDRENNHYESMNSQVTIIDLSSDNFSDYGLVSKQSIDSRSLKSEIIATDETSKGSRMSLKDKKCPLDYNDEYSKKHSDGVTRQLHSSPNVKTASKKDGKENDRFNRNKMQFEELFTKTKQLSNKTILSMNEIQNRKTSQIYNAPKSTAKKPIAANLSKNKKATPVKRDLIVKNPSSASASKKSAAKIYDRTSELLKARKRLAVVEKSKLSPSKNVTGSLNNISSGLTSPPKLVRQNSYTLEYPSPLLLAHLEVQSLTSGVEVGSISMSESTSTSQLCNLPGKSNKNVNNAKEFWSSIGSDINSLSVNEVSEPSKSTYDNIEDYEESISGSSKQTSDKKQNSFVSDSKSGVMQKSAGFQNDNRDVSSNVSSININTSSESSKTIHNPDDHSSVKSHRRNKQSTHEVGDLQNEFENVCIDFGERPNGKSEIHDASNVCLDYIMKKFHNDHEMQMGALVKKQQEEQLLLQKAFENQQHLLMAQFQNAYASVKSNSNSSKVSRTRDDGKNDKTDLDPQSNKIMRRDDSDNSQRSSISSVGISHLDGNTEKYLSISADVLNKSRCLLTNRRKVNLSPTNIQCVNVMPTQTGIFHIGGDMDNQRDDRPSSMKSGKSLVRKLSYNNDIPESGRSYNGSSDIKPDKLVNIETKLQISSRGNTSYAESLNTVYMSDDDPMATSRTNNTMDDVNFTFTSDGIQQKNNVYGYSNKDESYTIVPVSKEQERAEKIKKALTKISEIQKNLQSQAMGRSSNRSANYESSDYFQKSKYATDSDQPISLSSIEAMPYYYAEAQSQRGTTDRNALSLNLTEIHKPSSNKQTPLKRHKTPQQIEQEIHAASIIVAFAKGYLTRRLMKTERAESTVQTIRDTLYCALQLHRDEGGIQGADVDLHRRLIQQITSACYALHDMFIVYTPEERMSIISQDRERKLMLSHRSSSNGVSPMRQLSATSQRTIRRKLERMSRSHSGVFTNKTTRTINPPPHVMTRSHYEQSDHMRGGGMMDKARRSVTVAGEANSRKPWR